VSKLQNAIEVCVYCGNRLRERREKMPSPDDKKIIQKQQEEEREKDGRADAWKKFVNQLPVISIPRGFGNPFLNEPEEEDERETHYIQRPHGAGHTGGQEDADPTVGRVQIYKQKS